jgi:hypothetical protein
MGKPERFVPPGSVFDREAVRGKESQCAQEKENPGKA